MTLSSRAVVAVLLVLCCYCRGSAKDVPLIGAVVGPSLSPLADVRVVIEGTSFVTHTNLQGYFTFMSVPREQVVLVLSKPGYITQRYPVRVSGPQITSVLIHLELVETRTLPADTLYVTFCESPTREGPARTSLAFLEGLLHWDPAARTALPEAAAHAERQIPLAAAGNTLAWIRGSGWGHLLLPFPCYWLLLSLNGDRFFASTDGLVAVLSARTGRVLRRLPVEGIVYGMARAAGRVYVSASHSVEVLDDASGERLTSIAAPGQRRLSYAVPSMDGQRLYMALYPLPGVRQTGQVVATDAEGRVEAQATVGPHPMGLALAGPWLLVANETTASVLVLRATDLQSVGSIPVSGRPLRIVATDTDAYVSCANCPDGDKVYALDLAHLRSFPIDVAPGPLDLALSGGTLYVSCSGSGRVCAIDTASRQLLWVTSQQPGCQPFGISVRR